MSDWPDLARAVAQPGGNALLLDAKNKPITFIGLEEAIDADACFAVSVRDDILALDLDSAEAISCVDRFVERLAECNGRYVRVTSGGGDDREHLFARAPGMSRERLEGVAVSCSLIPDTFRWGNRRIRPPLSPHRKGGQGRLLHPSTVEEALAELGRAPSAHEADPRGLSPTMQALLARGDEEGRYGKRSAMTQAIVVAAVAAGLGDDWLVAVLLNPLNRGGEKIQEIDRERGRAAAVKEIERRIRDAERYLGDSDLPVIDQLERHAATYRWPSRTASTDFATYWALLAVARSAGSLEFTASQRQLQERAGLSSRHTLTKALERFTDSYGLLMRPPKRRTDRCGRFRLLRPEGLLLTTSSSYMGEHYWWGKLDPSHDAFAPGALGKPGYRVLSILTDTPLSVRDIADRLGRTRRTVRKHLNRLRDVELAANDGTGWVRCPTDLAAAASAFGSVGRREFMRDQHERERDAFALRGLKYRPTETDRAQGA